MSFSFGSATTTAANTFGTTTPSTGFAFGSGDAAKQGLFAANNAENKPAFNFSSPTGGGFAFNAAKTTAQTTSLFATPATAGMTSPFEGSKPMSFGGFASPPNQTVGSPSLIQPATQMAPPSMPFGGANQQTQQQQQQQLHQLQQQQQQQPAPAFGTPPSQAGNTGFGASPGSSFGFGKPPATTAGFGFATPASGFSAPPASTQQAAMTTAAPPSSSSFLGGPSPGGFPPAFGAKPGSAFSFGGGSAAAPPAFSAGAVGSPPTRPGFALPGQQQPATQTGLSFGTTTSAAPTGLTTGQPTGLTTGQPTGLSTGLNFGGAQQTAASAAPAFGTTTSSFQAPTALAQQNRLSFGSPATSTPAAPGTGLNFGTATSTSQPQAGLNFGSAPASTAQPTAGLNFGTPATTSQPSGLNFGSSGPIVSGTTTAGILGTSTANQPTAGPNFGTTSAAPTGLSFGTTTTAPAGLNFGAPASTAQTMQAGVSAPSTTQAKATTGLTAWSTSLSTGQSTAQPHGLSFGTSTVTAPVTGLSFGTVSTAASTMPPGFGLTGTSTSTGLSFGKPTTSIAASAASTSAPSGIIALGKTTATTAMASLTTATTTTASVPPQVISSITFAQLEENINKWTLELEEQEKTFINQATQINAWDRLLIANGEKIVELNDAVQSVKNEQQSLEHELDFVLAQQKELEDLLAPMEKQLSEETVDRLRDPEREHMYSLAENLDTQLRQMSEDLKEVIEHLNETNRSQDSNDPIVQIGRILNAHMSSMQWIDNSIAQISTKLDQLKATHDTLRRDNERSYQLTYN